VNQAKLHRDLHELFDLPRVRLQSIVAEDQRQPCGQNSICNVIRYVVIARNRVTLQISVAPNKDVLLPMSRLPRLLHRTSVKSAY